MLILSRKQGETIQVGDDITLTVVRIGPNTVRIGIDAPSDMNIVRSELLTESAVHGSSQDDARMDGEGQDAPCFDHEPLIVAGKYSL